MFNRVQPRHVLLTITAATLIALSWSALHFKSPTIEQFNAWGISRGTLAVWYLAGAVVVLVWQSARGYLIGTLPIVLRVVVTALVVADIRGGYPTLIMYLFMLALLYYAYFLGVGNHGH